MYFDYEQYYRACLITPILVIVIFGVPFVWLCILLLKNVFQRKICTEGENIKKVIGIMMLAYMFCIEGGCLLHGGIFLAQEKEMDAVQIQGYVSNIGALGRFEMPRLTTEYEYSDFRAVEFTINGMKCTAPTNGDLKVGDYVEVKYLPKSGYILYIDKVERRIIH